MSGRIIVSDLDETLIPPSKVVGRHAIEAVRAAAAQGNRFVPCTGRGYATVQGTLSELGLAQRPDQYVISYNGAMLSENEGNRVFSFKGLPFEKAEALFERGLGLDVCIHVYTRDTVWIYNNNAGEAEFLRGRQPYREFSDRDLGRFFGRPIGKVLYESDDDAYVRSLAGKVADITSDGVAVSYSSGRYIEFNREGVSKGRALRDLAGLLGVDMADTIAIGDNFNDQSMIREAGIGCGVANVVDGVRPDCDYVCQNRWDEGVAEVLERFVLA